VADESGGLKLCKTEDVVLGTVVRVRVRVHVRVRVYVLVVAVESI
jgi:hypothetical protein